MTLPRHWLSRIWLPVFLIAVWEISARVGLLDPIFFPPPSLLVWESFRMIGSGELTGQIRDTLLRTLEGASVGLAAGIACGIAMGAHPFFRRSLEPLVAAFSALPRLRCFPCYCWHWAWRGAPFGSHRSCRVRHGRSSNAGRRAQLGLQLRGIGA